jgi:hypothetical protein
MSEVKEDTNQDHTQVLDQDVDEYIFIVNWIKNSHIPDDLCKLSPSEVLSLPPIKSMSHYISPRTLRMIPHVLKSTNSSMDLTSFMSILLFIEEQSQTKLKILTKLVEDRINTKDVLEDCRQEMKESVLSLMAMDKLDETFMERKRRRVDELDRLQSSKRRKLDADQFMYV